MTGRSPGAMLIGHSLTQSPPGTGPPPVGSRGSWNAGGAGYSAILTPKRGGWINDLRILPGRFARKAPGALPFLDLPAAGLAGTLEHFGRFPPPTAGPGGKGSRRGGVPLRHGPRGPRDWLVREVFGAPGGGRPPWRRWRRWMPSSGWGGARGDPCVGPFRRSWPPPTWDVTWPPGRSPSALLRRAGEGVSVAEPARWWETLRVEGGDARAYGVEAGRRGHPHGGGGLEARGGGPHPKGCLHGAGRLIRPDPGPGAC